MSERTHVIGGDINTTYKKLFGTNSVASRFGDSRSGLGMLLIDVLVKMPTPP